MYIKLVPGIFENSAAAFYGISISPVLTVKKVREHNLFFAVNSVIFYAASSYKFSVGFTENSPESISIK